MQEQVIEAATRNDVEAVRLYLQQGIDVNAAVTGDESVFHAVIHLSCSLDVIRAFLEHGADVNVESANGFSALVMAVMLGDPDLLTLLLSVKDVNVNRVNGAGNTVLHYASIFGDETIVSLLKNADADVNAKNALGEVPGALAYLV
jgi:ankyrin repeat protein